MRLHPFQPTLEFVMKNSRNGGTMEATYTPIAFAGSTPRSTGLGRLVRAMCSVVAEVLADGVRGHDFDRAFTSAPGAQFAALPGNSKQRLLNRGLRS
jgi:hypothetical protein